MAERDSLGINLSTLTEEPRFLFQSSDTHHLHVRKSPDEGKPGEVLRRIVFTKESYETGQFLNQPMAVDTFFDHAPHNLQLPQKSGLPLENKI